MLTTPEPISTQGEYPDITWAVDSLYLSYQLGNVLRVEWRSPNFELFTHWDIPLEGGSGAFGRVYHHNNRVLVGYRLGNTPFTGHVHPVGEKRPEFGNGYLGVIHGALPIVFGHSGYAYIVGGAQDSYPVRVTTWAGESHPLVRFAQGTGLSRLDGLWPTTVDEDRNIVPGLFDPSFAGDCVVGATDRDGKPCIVAKRGNLECELWKGEDSPNPRMCTDGTNFYVIVWSGRGQGIRVAKIEPGDFKTPHVQRPSPFGVPVSEPRALGQFFGKRSKFGHYEDVPENCAVMALEMWQDSDGTLPVDVGAQIRASLREVGVGLISNTTIVHAAPEWKRVLGVFAGKQESRTVWAHEPTSVAEAQEYVRLTHEEMDRLKLKRRPTIVFLREDFATRKEFVGVADILAPELYFTAPEATYDLQLKVAREFMARVYEALSPSPLYYCVQAFDRIAGGTQWKENPWAMEAIQQAANEIVGRSRIKGLLWFAYARGGGVRAYPVLEQWHRAQLRVTPAPSQIVDPKPLPEKPQMAQVPGQAEFEDLAVFLHEVCYQGELKRAGGLFESPSSATDRIFDGRRPRGEVTMDDAAFRWFGEYNKAYQLHLLTPGGPHEAAKKHVRDIIHNSDEARRKRGEDPQ